MDNEAFIPPQQQGRATDALADQAFQDREQAIAFYLKATQRLLAVSQWHQICAIKASVFTLIDAAGDAVDRPAQVGDYFKIDIPGPGSTAGQGFDWVKIESIESVTDPDRDKETLVMKVRPAARPGDTSGETAHFLKSAASSTFLVSREGNKLSAEVHGRNEMPNTGADHLVDKVRNAAIGIGSFLGISVLQWKLLTEGVLDTKAT